MARKLCLVFFIKRPIRPIMNVCTQHLPHSLYNEFHNCSNTKKHLEFSSSKTWRNIFENLVYLSWQCTVRAMFSATMLRRRSTSVWAPVSWSAGPAFMRVWCVVSGRKLTWSSAYERAMATCEDVSGEPLNISACRCMNVLCWMVNYYKL
jgi:hypothetical protein